MKPMAKSNSSLEILRSVTNSIGGQIRLICLLDEYEYQIRDEHLIINYINVSNI